MCLPAGRCAMSTRPWRSCSAAATTRMTGLRVKRATRRGPTLLHARQRAVAVLVLLSRPARARLVASDLALPTHERPLRLGRRGRWRGPAAGAATRLRWAARRSGSHGGGGRLSGLLCAVRGQQRMRFRVLCLKRAHETAAALLLLAVDLLLGAHLDLREERHRLELDALEHGCEQLERLALVLESIVLLGVAAQVNALAQIVHGREAFELFA